MTIRITSLEHALDVARPLFAHAQAINPDSYIAGGYLRDADQGVQPKDIDIFAVFARADAQEDLVARADDAAARLYGILGQTYRLVQNEMAGEYPQGFRVYETVDKLEDQFPVNYIVRLDSDHTVFDFGICAIFWFGPNTNPIRNNYYNLSVEKQQHYVISWPQFKEGQVRNMENMRINMASTVNHFHRIHAKYPWPLVLDEQSLPTRWSDETSTEVLGFRVLQEENILGPSRTLLQAAGPEPQGNPMGLEDGIADLVEAEAALARRNFDRQRVNRAIEALGDRLRNQPQVQPGLNAILDDPWAAAPVAPVPDWARGQGVPVAG